MKQIIILSIVIYFLSFASCKDCDEYSPDNCIDCQKKFGGNWTLSYLATNSIDSTSYFDSIYQTSCIFYFEPWNKGTNYAWGPQFTIGWGDTRAVHYSDVGKYAGVSGFGILPIMFQKNSPIDNSHSPFKSWIIRDPGAAQWRVTRLSKNNIWLTIEDDENLCEIHLER